MVSKKQTNGGGLLLRGDTWHMRFSVKGVAVAETTRTGNRREAERILAARRAELVQQLVLGKLKPIKLHDAIDEYQRSRLHLPSYKNCKMHLDLFRVLPNHTFDKITDHEISTVIERRFAANDPLLEEAAKASGTSISRAFEKSINAAFTILGYDTRLMGQGAGRQPDGLASSEDESYAILWDAKARQGGYRMGTDDRAIREYVMLHSREMKRRRHFRNLYYFIVSSRFKDEFDDLIRGLKMDTDINEVCLVEADALTAMVDAKLRDPRQFSLGSDGIQRLFCQSGIVTAQSVRDSLG